MIITLNTAHSVAIGITTITILPTKTAKGFFLIVMAAGVGSTSTIRILDMFIEITTYVQAYSLSNYSKKFLRKKAYNDVSQNSGRLQNGSGRIEVYWCPQWKQNNKKCNSQ